MLPGQAPADVLVLKAEGLRRLSVGSSDIAILCRSTKLRSRTNYWPPDLCGPLRLIPFPWSQSTNECPGCPRPRNQDSKSADSFQRRCSRLKTQKAAAAWKMPERPQLDPR